MHGKKHFSDEALLRKRFKVVLKTCKVMDFFKKLQAWPCRALYEY